jgi:hypothetical protein
MRGCDSTWRWRPSLTAAPLIGIAWAFAARARQPDRFVVRFDRITLHRDAFADQVRLEMDATPAGSYVLTLEARDNVSGRIAVQTTKFVVAGERTPKWALALNYDR